MAEWKKSEYTAKTPFQNQTHSFMAGGSINKFELLLGQFGNSFQNIQCHSIWHEYYTYWSIQTINILAQGYKGKCTKSILQSCLYNKKDRKLETPQGQ